MGDCEDCAKEIFLEFYEWKHMKTNKPEVKAFQTILNYFIPFIVQGAVSKMSYNAFDNNDDMFKNHLWCTLIPKYIVKKNMNNSNIFDITTSYYDKTPFKTMLMEGTGYVFPYPTKIDKYFKQTSRYKTTLIKRVPELSKCSTIDYNTTGFYKYVIAMFTDHFKNKGILDYTLVHNYKYGISFENWWNGEYEIYANTVHSKNTMKLISEAISYDKPIKPLTYKSYVDQLHPYIDDGSSIKYGYCVRTDKDLAFHESLHKKIKKNAYIEALFDVSTHLINHSYCYWVEWVFNRKSSDVLKTDKTDDKESNMDGLFFII